MLTSLKRLLGYMPCIFGKGPEGYFYSYDEGITWILARSFLYLPVGIAWMVLYDWLQAVAYKLKLKYKLHEHDKSFWDNAVILDDFRSELSEISYIRAAYTAQHVPHVSGSSYPGHTRVASQVQEDDSSE